jgi:uncharacterized membrane protein YadS
LLFCGAAAFTTYSPSFSAVYARLNSLGKIGLTVTLYLIGSGISKPMLKQVGVRPLVLGGLLWAVVASLSLALVRIGAISIY